MGKINRKNRKECNILAISCEKLRELDNKDNVTRSFTFSLSFNTIFAMDIFFHVCHTRVLISSVFVGGSSGEDRSLSHHQG